MAVPDYKQEIMAAVDRLDSERQRRVLEFARNLSRPKGEPGKVFIERTRDIHIDLEELDLMKQAIEEACGVVENFPEVDFD